MVKFLLAPSLASDTEQSNGEQTTSAEEDEEKDEEC